MRCSLKNFYANKDKELEKRKKIYHNNREKIIDLEKNRRNIHENEIDEPNNKNDASTQAMETLKSIISVA